MPEPIPVYEVRVWDWRAFFVVLVAIEALLVGFIAGFVLGRTVHPVVGILCGPAALIFYLAVFHIPYVGIVLYTVLSLLYAFLAGWFVHQRADLVWTGFVSLSVFAFSCLGHRLHVALTGDRYGRLLSRLHRPRA